MSKQAVRGLRMLAVAAALCSAMAQESLAADAPRVSDLSVRPDGEGRFRLIMSITGTPGARCRILEGSGAELLVLDLSPAESGLKASYEFKETPLGPIRVTSTDGQDAKGVRVEVPLRGAVLKGWSVTTEGMEVLFNAPAAKAAVVAEGSSYRLGEGDRVELSVFGQDDLKQTLEVRADGTVLFPLIGVMPVAGRTLASVRGEVETRLKEFLVGPQVSLDIKDYQSQPVNVVGEVEKPGTYYLKGPTTLMDIMAQSGWMTREAGNEIIITRHENGTDGETRQINIAKDDLLTGGSKFNPRLQAGDVITVGPQQFFYIRGEVAKPGQYPLVDRPTLMKAVSIAEGLTPYAKKKGIEVNRNVNGKQTKLVFDLKAIEERKAEDILLLPGDVVIVPRRLF
ncbi:MAG TPA: polysaccharide biosynthesis/export family protein [Candidatus Polarisedimenticolia bacterium]|nr:polysaccharide biosynthesis/export family protein [Candidatus Polarisedimenticolia bacterium]